MQPPTSALSASRTATNGPKRGPEAHTWARLPKLQTCSGTTISQTARLTPSAYGITNIHWDNPSASDRFVGFTTPTAAETTSHGPPVEVTNSRRPSPACSRSTHLSRRSRRGRLSHCLGQMEPAISRSSNSSPGSGRIASAHRYTFVAMAVLILIGGVLAAFRSPIRADTGSPRRRQCGLSGREDRSQARSRFGRGNLRPLLGESAKVALRFVEARFAARFAGWPSRRCDRIKTSA
jgi:hypothetical protein